MDEAPSDMTPEVPIDTDEQPTRFPRSEEDPSEADDNPDYQDDEDNDDQAAPGPDGEP